MESRPAPTGINPHRVHVLDAFLQHLEETSANHGETCTAELETAAAADTRDEGEGDIRALASGAVSTRPLASPGDNVGRDVDVQREILRVLDWTFSGDRNLVDSCIQVLDNSRVVKVKARTSGRSIWLVQGSRGSSYLCLRNYCSCRSFLELVRRGFPQPILCKHLLAVRLAPALGVSRLEEVDDHRLADRIGDCSYG